MPRSLALFSVCAALLAYLLLAVCGTPLPADEDDPLPKGAVLRLGRREHKPKFNTIAFSRDGKFAATGQDTRGVRIWDLASGNMLQTIPKAATRDYVLLFSCDGQTLLAATDREEGFLAFDVASGKRLGSFLGGSKPLWSIGSVVLETNVVALGVGPEVQFWDFEKGEELKDRRMGGVASEVRAIAVAPDRRTLAGAATDPSRSDPPGNRGEAVCIWDMSTKKLRQSFKNPRDYWVRDISFSLDGRLVICMAEVEKNAGELLKDGYDPQSIDPIQSDIYAHIIRVWEVASGKEVLTIPRPKALDTFLNASPDGRLLAGWADYQSDLIQIWDSRTGEEVRRFEFPHVARNYGSVAFSPDGKRLATVGRDEALLWDVSDLPQPPTKAPALKADALDRLWSDLASDDAPAARKAVYALEDSPAQAVPFLRDHLKPVPSADARKVAALLAALNHDDLQVRESASADLEAQGEAVADALRKAQADAPPAETKRRLEELVARLGWPIKSPARLRTLRAMEVLEHIGGPDAVAALRDMAKGAEEAVETEEAKWSLKRLEGRKDKP